MRVPLLLGAQPLVTPPTRISLGSGIPLDLAIGDGGVQGVAGGPTWTGGGYWSSDGVGYWTGPTIAFGAAHTIVTRLSAVDFAPLLRVHGTGHWTSPTTFRRSTHFGYLGSAYYAVLGSANASASTSIAAGSRTTCAGLSTTTRIAVDAGSPVVGTAPGDTANAPGTVPFNVGVYVDSGAYPSLVYNPAAAGLKVWDVTVYQRMLSDAEMAAMGAGQINPLTISADAYACWDFATAESDGVGGYRVPDLVLGDHTRDLVAVSTDLTDITTGATF